MKKTYSFTLFLLVSFFVANNVWALKNSGDIQGSYKEVVAYSNGPNAGTSNGEHQCPKYVRRFYKQAFGINIDNAIGVARNYYVNFNSKEYEYLKKSGLVRYSNGGSSLPSPGDILIFDHTNGIGHVSIKKETTNTEIGLIEQNWSRENCSRNIGYVCENGTYRINTVSNYSVLGWLHMPVGEFSNGWHFDSDIQGMSNLYNLNSRPFTVCFQANGGADTLGVPTNKVHKYPAITSPYSSSPYSYMRQAWVQDFSKNGLIFSLVVNEYVLSPEQGYLGVAYPIGGKHRLFWLDNYWKIGYPVTNEYYYSANKNWIIQWFERLDEEYYVVIYDAVSKNIWYENGNNTSIPKENFTQHKLLNGTTPSEGLGGGPFLSPPYNLQADTVDNQSIQLTWTLPNGTDDYNIKIYRNGVLLKNFSAIDSIIINGLSANTTYCFQASLFCNSSGEESAKSAEVCATTNINPPPPPQNWTIANERVTTQVNSITYQPIDEKYGFEKSVGKYLNYWVKLDSNNSGLNFEWRLFYTFDDSRVWNAQTSSNQPAYLCQKYSYFDSANQEYYIWHKIEANALLFIGQYRVELWIDGQKASSRCFDLTMPAPDYFRLNGTPTQALTSFSWLGLGDNSVSGSGVELFMDNNRIAFIPGYSNGYTIASNVRGTHDFRIREVNVYPAGTFRSPFSAPLSVMIKLNKVTGVRITN